MSGLSPRPRLLTMVLVSGLSGAGRASVLRTLEDIGFEAVDNPPIELITDLAARALASGETRRIAVGVDARARGFDADAVTGVLATLRRNPAVRAELVFVWADEAVLLRRYTETRRRHPLAPQGRVADGIAAEQLLTASLHEAADLLIDTSDLPLAALRRTVEERFSGAGPEERQVKLAVSLISFAFPAGLPRESDMVLDARFLRNPHYVTELKPRTGLDPEVKAYVVADPDFAAFYAKVVDLLELVLPRFVQEGKKYATISVGCTGGRHRSVTIVEMLALQLAGSGWRVTTTHRELARESALKAATAQRGGVRSNEEKPNHSASRPQEA
jgi:RNase adapter protein RapZ